MKNKLFVYGLLSSFFGTAFGVVSITLLFSKGELIESLQFLYLKNQLGGVISLGAMVNLILFFVAIRKEKYPFATGVVVFSLVLVLIVALLKGI